MLWRRPLRERAGEGDARRRSRSSAGGERGGVIAGSSSAVLKIFSIASAPARSASACSLGSSIGISRRWTCSSSWMLLMRAASTSCIGPSARAMRLASRTTIVSSSAMRLRSGAIWSNGRTSAYHLSASAFSRHRLDGLLQLVAVEPLAPEVEHEHLGQELFVLAPAAVAFADGDEHLHQQGPVQVVHELDELLGGVGQQVRRARGPPARRWRRTDRGTGPAVGGTATADRGSRTTTWGHYRGPRAGGRKLGLSRRIAAPRGPLTVHDRGRRGGRSAWHANRSGRYNRQSHSPMIAWIAAFAAWPADRLRPALRRAPHADHRRLRAVDLRAVVPDHLLRDGPGGDAVPAGRLAAVRHRGAGGAAASSTSGCWSGCCLTAAVLGDAVNYCDRALRGAQDLQGGGSLELLASPAQPRPPDEGPRLLREVRRQGGRAGAVRADRAHVCAVRRRVRVDVVSAVRVVQRAGRHAVGEHLPGRRLRLRQHPGGARTTSSWW